jgi:hypothetical protein
MPNLESQMTEFPAKYQSSQSHGRSENSMATEYLIALQKIEFV